MLLPHILTRAVQRRSRFGQFHGQKEKTLDYLFFLNLFTLDRAERGIIYLSAHKERLFYGQSGYKGTIQTVFNCTKKKKKK